MLALVLGAGLKAAAPACPLNVWGFYPYYWKAQGFDSSTILYDHLTAVVHFAISPNSDGSITVPGGLLEPLLMTRAHAAGDKVLIDCGGGGSQIATMAAAFLLGLAGALVSLGYHLFGGGR